MAKVELTNVTKIYDNKVTAIKEVNLVVENEEFVVLVGPSGCGKSTLLRMIAGLEDITSGEIKIDRKVVNLVSPKDRDISMVFQNYALYPHMTVYENMAFGLKLRKFSKKEIKNRVNEAARILNIEEFLDRKPKALSGGQRQRVALGRAIVRKPKDGARSRARPRRKHEALAPAPSRRSFRGSGKSETPRANSRIGSEPAADRASVDRRWSELRSGW